MLLSTTPDESTATEYRHQQIDPHASHLQDGAGGTRRTSAMGAFVDPESDHSS